MCAERTEKDTTKKEERYCIKRVRKATVRKERLMTMRKAGIDKQETEVYINTRAGEAG